MRNTKGFVNFVRSLEGKDPVVPSKTGGSKKDYPLPLDFSFHHFQDMIINVLDAGPNGEINGLIVDTAFGWGTSQIEDEARWSCVNNEVHPVLYEWCLHWNEYTQEELQDADEQEDWDDLEELIF